MNRRSFLAGSVSALAASAAWRADAAPPPLPAPLDTQAQLTAYFRTILSGFLRNARATGADYAVCDFPAGRKIKG